jgi:hypothetical protein
VRPRSGGVWSGESCAQWGGRVQQADAHHDLLRVLGDGWSVDGWVGGWGRPIVEGRLEGSSGGGGGGGGGACMCVCVWGGGAGAGEAGTVTGPSIPIAGCAPLHQSCLTRPLAASLLVPSPMTLALPPLRSERARCRLRRQLRPPEPASCAALLTVAPAPLAVLTFTCAGAGTGLGALEASTGVYARPVQSHAALAVDGPQ